MYATRAGELVPELKQLLEDADYPGRDLEITHQRASMSRGPIKRIWINDLTLFVELAWVAYKKNGTTPWVDAPGLPKQYEYSIAWWSPEDVAGILFLNPAQSARILSGRARLSKAEVMKEFHLEVHVRHHLYPPFPFGSELQNVGIVHNVDPPRPQTQSEVEVTAITFVVYAFNRRAAEAWCRAECGRFRLPVISIKLVRLRPGL